MNFYRVVTPEGKPLAASLDEISTLLQFDLLRLERTVTYEDDLTHYYVPKAAFTIIHSDELSEDSKPQNDLDEQIDKLHGPGASAAIEAAFADGSIFNQ